MILRRITQHVQDQNWTAIGIDFVIVVVGVFIGLQVSNWNAARTDQARIATLLQDTTRDLRADIAELEGVLETTVWRLSAVDMVLDHAGRKPSRQFPTPDGSQYEIVPIVPFARDSAHSPNVAITWLSTFDGNRHAYESLVSTGDFRLLEDRALAAQIQDYYTQADELRDFEVTLRDFRDQTMVVEANLGVGASDAISTDDLVALVIANPGLGGALNNQWTLDEDHRQGVRHLSEAAAALIEAIDAYQP